MKKIFYFSFAFPLILTTFISCFFIPFFLNQSNSTTFTNSLSAQLPTDYHTTNFLWPTPGYTKITSHFGYRTSPITGKKAYHSGIDIAAPENGSIIAIDDGVVFYIGWYGANGYTVILQHKNQYKSIYGHISPTFLVAIGDIIKKGQLIAKVGPKYIEKKSYTNYQDKNGNYTNGATTRSSSAFFHYPRKKEKKSTTLLLKQQKETC